MGTEPTHHALRAVNELIESRDDLAARLSREMDAAAALEGRIVDLEVEVGRLRAAVQERLENCSCRPSGQTCDQCHPLALALLVSSQ